MFINSGECRLCETGLPTGFFDMTGKSLFTGDIVIIFTKDYLPDGLTVIVRDDFHNYSNGTHPQKDDGKPFAMGIKGCSPQLVDGETIFTHTDPDNDSTWHVRKVKDFYDVVDGEHWKYFGFNYSIN